jgi:hypothetical protein
MAGTDSKVYIKITGSQFKTEKIFLTKSKTNRNPFEKGKTDTFELNLPELGEIKKIRYSLFFIHFNLNNYFC